MQIPLVDGRDFTTRDTAQSPPVLIANETFVRQFLGGGNPVGKIIRTNAEPHYPETQYEIVGMVKDTKYGGLRDEIPPEAVTAIARQRLLRNVFMIFVAPQP
jgi:hypothetical protein